MKWIRIVKKPIEVRAFKLLKEHKRTFSKDILSVRKKITYSKYKDSFFIHTFEGLMECKEGDYVIKGIRGELHPCKKEIFEESYTVIDEIN